MIGPDDRQARALACERTARKVTERQLEEKSLARCNANQAPQRLANSLERR